jgi:Fe-S-cluster containining protein
MDWFSSKRPWYAAGLAFGCSGCGGCCAGPEEGYVWVTQREMERIAEVLKMPVAEFRRTCTRRVGGRFTIVEDRTTKDCIFLGRDEQGNRRCRIYSVRPTQCRTWPFWPGNLTSPDAWAAALLRCPGINRGPLHSLEEIEEARRRTRMG